MKTLVLLAPWLFLRAALLSAQALDASPLTLERIFSSAEFYPEFFGPARWLADGASYTTLEPSTTIEEAMDIVRYEAETGRRQVIVPAERLVPPGAANPLVIEDYDWSPDGRRLLVFTESRRVWRLNTRGDYWVLDLETQRLHRLGGNAEPSSLLFAKFSPDGDRAAYVHRNNLYVEDLAGGRITQLTADGSRTTINGTFDWVYEEEFFLRDGFRWSPDGAQIAYWQLDASGIRDFFLINNTDSLYSYVIPVQYPKAGTTNSAGRVGVVPAAGGPTRWMDVPGDPRNHYIARMDWAPGSSEALVLQQLNRLQNTNRVMRADAGTGRVRTVLVEQDSAWVDVPESDYRWYGSGGGQGLLGLEGGRRFLWTSERNGWRHVYSVSADGTDLRLVTPGDFDVAAVEAVDAREDWLYYTASPDNPTQRYLYQTRLDGRGRAERLSPADQPGTHTYQIAPGARWAFHTYSTAETPPATALVRLPEHTVVRTLVDNAALRARVEALRRRPVEFFRVPIGEGVALDAWLMKPADFDSTRTYPILFYVYGEPWSQTVLDAWGYHTYLWHLMLTERGYLVASVDNRGTPSLRGRAWRKMIYGAVGVLASQDQAAAARALARARPYVDSTRIGVWGWSGGGSMTLNLLFRSPELYRMGMSVAPVPDQRLYDTIYQERYMGLPDENAEGYRLGSPITFAHRLRGDLLLVHGTGDDNVHYQGTERLINALVAANKPFTMMAYPNRSHGIFEGENTRRHLYELLTRYLTTHLPAGPEPR